MRGLVALFALGVAVLAPCAADGLAVTDVTAESIAQATEAELEEMANLLVAEFETRQAEVKQLTGELAELQSNFSKFLASTTAERHRNEQWKLDFMQKVQQLSASNADDEVHFDPEHLGTHRALAASNSCTEPSGPNLMVHGVCECTGGLIVNGRNVTQELDELLAYYD
eukprot:INCI20290.1.p2 GENE.INCI20290.1~~INCI20290.1.p2  ORF type:complete len:169 (+),score=42.27 INCI20290.1:301-807(+)